MVLLFDLINFGVIVGLLFYAFIRYVLPALREQKIQKQLLYDTLEAKGKELLSEQQKTQSEIHAQQKFFEEARKKIAIWQETIRAFREQEYNKREIIQKKLVEKRALQSDNVSLYHARQEVIPQAVTQAQHQLEKIMRDTTTAQEYADNIITFMRK